MPIYKRCSQCGKRLPSGSRCDCLKLRHKEYDKYSRDKKLDDFYHSGEWELTRKEVLLLDKGIDVYLYMISGQVVLADMIHHIEPLKDNWDRRCDIDNLFSLSHDIHSMIEAMYKKDKQETMKLLYEMLKEYRSRMTN